MEAIATRLFEYSVTLGLLFAAVVGLIAWVRRLERLRDEREAAASLLCQSHLTAAVARIQKLEDRRDEQQQETISACHRALAQNGEAMSKMADALPILGQGLNRLADKLAVVALCLFALAGCGDKPPPRGSAQDHAAGAAARAEDGARAADDAGVEAARAGALAEELERRASADPTPARIRAAADARVDAATTAAVAEALDRQARRAAEEAASAREAARKERAAEAADADLRRWVNLCRWIGLAGVAAGALLGGLLCWFVSPKVGAPVGGLIVGTALLVVAFGATVIWLPVALGAVVVAGLVVMAFYHFRTLGLAGALSQTVDALEGKATTTLADAKKALGKAVGRSGLKGRLTRARARWKPA